MTEQFWYGLLALPALLIALGLAVVIPLGALYLIDVTRKWRLKKLSKAKIYESTLFDKPYFRVDDPDDRLLSASIMATAEKLRFINTPLGAFFYSSKRYDHRAARRLESLLKKDLLRDTEEGHGTQ